MKAHIISLKNSPRRLEAQQRASAAGFEACFFDAIDASTDPIVENLYLTSSQKFISRYGRRQTTGELANLLSHQSLYKSLQQYPLDYHLILEDDFIPLVDAKYLSNVVSLAAGKDADIVILGYSKVDDELEKAINVSNPLMNTLSIPSTNSGIGQRCLETTCGAVSYLVSPRFLDELVIIDDYARLTDDWTYHDQLGLKIMHVKPLCFREDYKNMSSTLELSRSKSSRMRRVRLPSFLRPFWRAVLGLGRRLQYYAKNVNG